MIVEAARQALYLLEEFVDDPRCQGQIDATSIALRQAIEAAEKQEPKCQYPRCSCNSKDWCDPARQQALDKKAAPQPQREWVGLTDEDIKRAPHHMVDGAYHYSFKQGAEWAEAKLKEKNT